MQVTHEQLKRIIPKYAERKISLMIKGHPGIGKSYAAREVATEFAKTQNRNFVEWDKINNGDKLKYLTDKDMLKKDYLYVDVRATLFNPEDLKGLPDFSGNKDVLVWKPVLIFKILAQPECAGMLFLDERNNAMPFMQTALYQIINDRQIGELTFSPNITIISAGNLIEDKGNVQETPTPLRDREGEVELLVPEVDVWVNWGMKNNIDTRCMAYLKFKNSHLYKMDFNSGDKPTTPRGWERTSLLISDVEDLQEIKELACSSLGDGVGIEFTAFVKLNKQLKVEDYLENPKKIKQLEDISMKYALLSAVADYFKKHKNDKILKQIVALGDNLEAEMCRLMLRFVRQADSKFFSENIIKFPEGKKLMLELSKYF